MSEDRRAGKECTSRASTFHELVQEESRDHEEWLDENFGNECLNCGAPRGHTHTC